MQFVPRDFNDDTPGWSRIGREQNQLQADVRRVREYGRAHPMEWVGLRFDNARPVRVIAAFTDHLDIHEQALRSLVEHPRQLAVEREPYSAAQLERIREDLHTRLFEGDQRVAVAVGMTWAKVFVHFRASAELVARELHERYGDALVITVGAMPFPLRAFNCCPPKPEPTLTRDGLELRLVLDQASVPSGDGATGRLVVRNAGHEVVELETGEPTVGVALDRDGQVVGVYSGAIAGVGRLLKLGPGEEGSVSAIVGTASCSSRVGYLLPPGRYSALVPLNVYGPRPPTGEHFDVLVPPPAALVLT